MPILPDLQLPKQNWVDSEWSQCIFRTNLSKPGLPPVLPHPTDEEAYGLLALEALADVLVPGLLSRFAQAPHYRILWRGVQLGSV